MTDKEIALEIAQTVLRTQMKEVALNGVLERFQSQRGELLQEVREAHQHLLSDRVFLDRIAELKKTFDAATPGDDLIQLLHREILRRQ